MTKLKLQEELRCVVAGRRLVASVISEPQTGGNIHQANAVMAGVAAQLGDEEIQALATFAAGLHNVADAPDAEAVAEAEAAAAEAAPADTPPTDGEATEAAPQG